MLDYVLLARARKMLANEATELHGLARVDVLDSRTYGTRTRALQRTITAEACDYAADALHNVLSKADAFLDDKGAREALRHE